MYRRGFLVALGGAAALVFDPERALWKPGTKLISIPTPQRGSFSNSGEPLTVQSLQLALEEFQRLCDGPLFLRPQYIVVLPPFERAAEQAMLHFRA